METIRPDHTLLNFETYSEYIKSLITISDQRYLQNQPAATVLVKLGFRTTNRIYDEPEFTKIREKTLDLMNPMIKSIVMCGTFLTGDDPALKALAEREQPNILQKLSTIIFLVVRLPNGFDVSGYIDYGGSLRSFNLNQRGAINWKAVFKGTDKLRPRPSDLSFYDLHTKYFSFNHSDNYHTSHLGQSLAFKHKGDHKIIEPEGRHAAYQGNAKRTQIYSPLLGTVVLYDHVVRKKV
ncbi:hypothetical protein KR222_007219 [Zaprionus bogoriensis]|nr:hypothetical protein KR222_007219 [Zaprionus bogoriensis]